jgi:hypothetical protein
VPRTLRERRRPLWRTWLVALAVSVVYAALVLSVNRAEVHSEMQKIDRGVFTDTFPPLIFTKAVTLPASATSVASVPNYPVDFDRSAYRSVVEDGSRTLLQAGLAQALGIFLCVWGFLSLVKRQRSDDVLSRAEEPPFPAVADRAG